VDGCWICIVLNKNLCAKGFDKALKEMHALSGDDFIDFKMTDDDFDGDCYVFLKCNKSIDMSPFRKSSNIVAVLDSYDNPTFLTDSEVKDFTEVEEEDRIHTQYGDMVQISGDGHFSGLYGVVTKGGCESSMVLFRFHTVTKRERINNDYLIVSKNVFKKLKIPVKNIRLRKGRDGKFPANSHKDG